ncbi:L-2-hydroxyglutarate oxidase [Micromonospora sp. PLK6-60]|uniref:L-2-hydroxyglutarate oxidase n=1 Tax=Micromonospora sp. PLK6-60 TaxID=2873383 RepID=UPI001CA6AE7D|nr:L-2-hydroxyglutarate oxidase [Micromonospora sp. PLK6-60]MBY8875035.1 L-2-hydroxyglutarate oxidase [Micromonospora sp. PLK6-60]
MSDTKQAVGVVGGGIVGLAVARELLLRRPGADVTVFEKEDRLAAHQTGHNSGVVHAGLYYPPGSLKARLCRRGVGLLREYCAEHRLPYRELGKLVVALNPAELPALDRIEERARANGVPDLARLDRAGIGDREPAVAGIAALHSPRTAVVDFVAVCERLAADVRRLGGQVLTSTAVHAVRPRAGLVEVSAGHSRHALRQLVVCAGLSGDTVAAMVGSRDDTRILPFRGEYYRLRADARDRVRGLVYPVPDPRYPFLGIHLTRHVDDEVLAGPNAVLALSTEGYTWGDVSARDLARIVAWPGTARMARRHWRTGVRELAGSLSRRRFARHAARYLPGLTADDLVRAPAGVRAQAVARNGSLVDDFLLHRAGPVLLVRNAPSPAATSSLAIAEHVVDRLAAA